MAADEDGGGGGGGEGTPFIKKEEEFDDSNNNNPTLLHENHVEEINNNNNNKGISIAERRAAKCGFNASNMNASWVVPPPAYFPYLTVPPGISPSALLIDSPIMLPNDQAQLSPTTGTFPQFPSPNHESLKHKLKISSSNGDNIIVAMDSSSNAEPTSNFSVENKSFEELEYPRDIAAKAEVFGNKSSREAECLSTLQPSSNSSRNQMFMMTSNYDQINDHTSGGAKEIRSTPEKRHNQKGYSIPKELSKCAEDGFVWKKYGQKHVKGSEYPRSYFKCNAANCRVTKKVERSPEGYVTEIVYNGDHNHPHPQPPIKRITEMSSSSSSDHMNDQLGSSTAAAGSCFKTTDEAAGKDVANVALISSDWRSSSSSTHHDGILDRTCSSTPLLNSDHHFPDHHPADLSLMSNKFQTVDEAQEFPPAFGSGQDVDNDRNRGSPESITFNDEYVDDENGECEPKRRKRESFPGENTVPRSTREPKVVLQIKSDIDILEDGYKWRKYGQKVVKGNPNPRSYYKCTTSRCPVRKHVERVANDIKSVLTTYEGKHNHEVPCSNSKTAGVAGNGLVIPDVANLPPALVTNNIVSTTPIMSTTMAHDQINPDHHHALTMKAAGNQHVLHHQDHPNLPLYLQERPPILSYNELMMRSSNNFPGNLSGGDLMNFGANSSSVCALSPPLFHSFPYGSLLINSNRTPMKMTTYPTSSSNKHYPMIPDYMTSTLQPISQINNLHHVNSGLSSSGNNNVPLACGNNFHYNKYAVAAAIPPSTTTPQGQSEIRDSQTNMLVKPKEEHRDDEVHDNCLSMPNHSPNHSNGTT